MIQNFRWATLGNTITRGLVYAALLCGLSCANLYAAPKDDRGQGDDHGNSGEHGRGLGHNHVTSINIVPTITTLAVKDGQLLASGVVSAIVNGEPVFAGFSDVPVTLAVNQDPPCPLLNVQLPPLHLNLLGLVLDTTAICVNVTANAGAGLLGDLLCSVANALQAGSNLTQIVNGLAQAELNNLLLGLTAVINGALAPLANAVATSIIPAATGPGTCSAVSLTLPPINLNVLGLGVTVDNCAGGTAAVALSGQPGTLLGNLTCSLVSGSILNTSLGSIISGLLGLL